MKKILLIIALLVLSACVKPQPAVPPVAFHGDTWSVSLPTEFKTMTEGNTVLIAQDNEKDVLRFDHREADIDTKAAAERVATNLLFQVGLVPTSITDEIVDGFRAVRLTYNYKAKFAVFVVFATGKNLYLLSYAGLKTPEREAMINSVVASIRVSDSK